MVTGKKTFGKAKPMVVGLAVGVGAALLITLLFAVVVTQLVLGEKIGEGTIGYWTGVMLPLSTGVGAWIAVCLVKSKKMQTCLLTAAVYFLCLLGINALFFGGQFQGVVVSVVMILLGAATTGIIAAKGERKGHNKRRKYHSR